MIPYVRPKRPVVESLLDKVLTPASQITFSVSFDKTKYASIRSALRALPSAFFEETKQSPQLPRHVHAMTPSEIQFALRLGEGRGSYDTFTNTIKVDPHMNADDVLFNVIREMLHADLPWMMEDEVGELTSKIFRRVHPSGGAGPTPSAAGLDATQLTEHLWMGSKPEMGRAVGEAGFDLLVLCAEEYQPPYGYFPGVDVIHAPFDDNDVGPLPAEKEIACAAAHKVADALRAARPTLVTCFAGRNRSGLVAGLALAEIGLDPLRAISLIRERRPRSLTNQWFVDLIAKSR